MIEFDASIFRILILIINNNATTLIYNINIMKLIAKLLTQVGSIALFTGLTTAYYHHLPVVPGIGNIGQTFSVLNPESSTGN